MSQETIRPFHILKKALKRFLKVIDYTQQLKVRENVVGFEKALGAVEVIKDRIQYRSQSLFNLARGHFTLPNVSIYVPNRLRQQKVSSIWARGGDSTSGCWKEKTKATRIFDI